MKAFIVCIAYLGLFCGGTNFAFGNNQNEAVSIEERLDEIQYSLNQMFMETSEQMEALTTEIQAVKQTLDHLSWYSEHVKQSIASIQNGNDLLLRNVTLLTLQSDEIVANQQYCANHEALKNLFFELKPKCGEFHPSPKPPETTETPETPETPETVFDSCRHVPQQSGVYRLTVNGSYDQHFQAYCEMDEFGGRWTVFQKRQDGSVNFNRGWNDYKNGFGSPAGEYWLGLQTLHELTTQSPHELLILLESFNGTIKYERYSGIVVNSELDKYKLIMGGSGNGTAGESFYVYRGEIFVTYDVQSGSHSSCAKTLASGFWHYNCDTVTNKSNLNGVYGTNAGKQGIWWNTFSEGIQYNPLKRVQMMIREKTN